MIPSCDWTAPGQDRYTGSVPAAVESYRDIPAPIRQRLRSRMERRQYDEVVTITRDAILGKHRYAPELTAMHFGSRGRVCATVDRSKWAPGAVERGLVYCEAEHCIVVPTVCSNVARVQRLPDEPPVAIAPPVAEDVPIEPALDLWPGAVLPPVETASPTAQEPAGETFAGPGMPTYLPPFPGAPGGGIPGSWCKPCEPVPEPPALALLAAGMAAIGWVTRRRG